MKSKKLSKKQVKDAVTMAAAFSLERLADPETDDIDKAEAAATLKDCIDYLEPPRTKQS